MISTDRVRTILGVISGFYHPFFLFPVVKASSLEKLAWVLAWCPISGMSAQQLELPGDRPGMSGTAHGVRKGPAGA
jgi:hypothetical protein